MRGIVSREIGGKVRHFHFGTQMFIDLEEKGLSLSKFQSRMQEKMFSTTADILYHAAVSFCKINKQDVDFEREDVSVWIDEMGISDSVQMITDGLSGLQKNVKALETDQG